MSKLIEVCESLYGNRTCIYHYINPDCIVELHTEETQSEINVEATLNNGMRVIIYNKSDLRELLGEDKAEKMINEINERHYERLEKEGIIRRVERK